VARAYTYLLDELDPTGAVRTGQDPRPRLALAPLGAGPFALVDAAGLGLDDVSYARLLADRYSTLVVPVSWSPAGQRTVPETRIRAALPRPGHEIERFARVLKASADDVLAGSTP
jgi:hypothetical protein